MPRRLHKFGVDFHLPGYTQISESHCGPAVIQMLLGNLGIEVTQEAVAEAGGATELIELNGMRVDQLAKAVSVLAPQALFWYRDHASMNTLIQLVNKYKYPVGVEWQGKFEDDEEEDDEEDDEEDEDDEEEDDDEEESLDDSETEGEDYGHYSIVTYVSRKKKELIIVDPYKDFSSQDRIFSFEEFRERWYDFNEVPDPETGRSRLVEDYHMLFVVTPVTEPFPLELGMHPGK